MGLEDSSATIVVVGKTRCRSLRLYDSFRVADNAPRMSGRQGPPVEPVAQPSGSAAMESVMSLHRSKRQSRSPGSMGEDPEPESLPGR